MMIKKITLSALFLLFINSSFPQIQSYSCVIPKEACQEYFIVNEQLDSTKISKLKFGTIDINSKSYTLKYGKGRERDFRGIKEKQKKYLIEPNGNKAYFTWKNDGNIYVNDSITIEIVPTNFGWQFVENDSIVICEADLLWNNVSWNYYIQYYELGEKAKAIKKYLSVNMVSMASERSGYVSKDEERVGFILSLLEIFLYSYY
ncbi:MAG: hypothetical protein ACPGVD_07375 [Flavobacteriales bacterium]